MKKRRRTYVPDEKFGLIDVGGLSSMLGISPSKIYKLTMGEKLPFLKVGGKILFRLTEIEPWLENQRVSN